MFYNIHIVNYPLQINGTKGITLISDPNIVNGVCSDKYKSEKITKLLQDNLKKKKKIDVFLEQPFVSRQEEHRSDSKQSHVTGIIHSLSNCLNMTLLQSTYDNLRIHYVDIRLYNFDPIYKNFLLILADVKNYEKTIDNLKTFVRNITESIDNEEKLQSPAVIKNFISEIFQITKINKQLSSSKYQKKLYSILSDSMEIAISDILDVIVKLPEKPNYLTYYPKVHLVISNLLDIIMNGYLASRLIKVANSSDGIFVHANPKHIIALVKILKSIY